MIEVTVCWPEIDILVSNGEGSPSIEVKASEVHTLVEKLLEAKASVEKQMWEYNHYCYTCEIEDLKERLCESQRHSI